MDDPPLVTVVVATHGGDRPEYLQAALESVVSQTLRDLEVCVVVDGQVPVALQHILETFAREDARVTIHWMPVNQGPGAARNAVIAKARGEFVAILDADDRALPDRLARQVSVMRQLGADVLGSWYHLIDEEGCRRAVRRMPTSADHLRRAMVYSNPVANSTVLARTEVLRAHGYPCQYRFAEDFHLWVTLAIHGYRLMNLGEPLTEHRRDTTFITRRTGWSVFVADAAAKLRAVSLYPPGWRLPAAMAAVVTSMPRLLPGPLLSLAYRLRDLRHRE